MTLSHATMTTQVSRLPRNDFGQPLLDDADTIQDWWSQRDDASDERLNVRVVTGTTNFDTTLLDLTMPEGIREPDLYDEGKAVWLSGDAVVSMDMDEVRRLPRIIAQDARYVDFGKGVAGWMRIHPSSHGVEVDSFHEHNGEVASHSAHEAWSLLVKAVSA